jgi:hypothetical protein
MVQLEQLAMTGVTAFQNVAENFVGTFFAPARELSAAINYYLAGKLVGSAMCLQQRDELLDRLHRKLRGALTVVETKGEYVDELRFMSRFAAAEFLPIQAKS